VLIHIESANGLCQDYVGVEAQRVDRAPLLAEGRNSLAA